MDMTASVFVLSTEHGHNAAATLIRLLKSQGVDAQKRLGVDHRNLVLEDDERIGRQSWFYRTHGRRITRPETARYVSHYRLLKHAMEHNLERIVVLEGRALPVPAFKHIIDAVDATDDSTEFIVLHVDYIPSAAGAVKADSAGTLLANYLTVPMSDDLSDTICYTVSLSGLRKIVPQLMPITCELHVALSRMLRGGSVSGSVVWPQASFKHPYAHDPGWQSVPSRNMLLRLTGEFTTLAVRKLAQAVPGGGGTNP